MFRYAKDLGVSSSETLNVGILSKFTRSQGFLQIDETSGDILILFRRFFAQRFTME